MKDKNNGRAVIENEAIVVRVQIDTLAHVAELGWMSGALGARMRVTDASVFARDLVLELNREDEVGTTAVHRMFDRAIAIAYEQGAEGVEDHP